MTKNTDLITKANELTKLLGQLENTSLNYLFKYGIKHPSKLIKIEEMFERARGLVNEMKVTEHG